MWLHMECCCSFLSATKATCFYFLRLGPCSFELWRNTVRYVTYEMKGMNANQQNTTQSRLCQPGSETKVLFQAALCLYLELLFWKKRKLSVIPAVQVLCYCTLSNSFKHIRLWTTIFTFPAFQLLPSVFVPLNCFHHYWRILSTEVIPGSVTLIHEQIDIKGTPNIKFAFISLCRGAQPPKHHLTHHRTQPDLSRNPALVFWQVSMPLSSADMRQLLESTWLALKAFGCKEIGCVKSTSQAAQESI